jgi:hypothetical protein
LEEIMDYVVEHLIAEAEDLDTWVGLFVDSLD